MLLRNHSSALMSATATAQGTLVKHFGYDLSGYPSPLGPNSLYGSLNTILFDPVMPIWLDDRVHSYRRVIKGSRNALNGAVDDGDERTGPALSHNVPMFNVSLGDFGRIGIEYWVLEQPTRANKRPSAAFVNPAKPKLGYLLNFGAALMKDGIVRAVNGLEESNTAVLCASAPLRETIL